MNITTVGIDLAKTVSKYTALMSGVTRYEGMWPDA